MRNYRHVEQTLVTIRGTSRKTNEMKYERKCSAVKKKKEKANFAIANIGISKTQKCLHDEVTNDENVDHFLLRQGSF